MQRNTRWTGLYTAILCVAGFGPARADITAVLPVEGGTVGTEITLMGSGFGEKRGKVQLGTEACQILSWGDTIVICEVVSPQPAGDYTVTLSPQGSNQGDKKALQPMTFSSFTLRAPQVTPGDPLQLVAPGQRVTIAGAFFGDKKGEVYLRDTPGDTVSAKVRNWSMDSISFDIPRGLRGYLALGVTNEVGSDIQPLWGTLTPLPPGATARKDIEVWDKSQVNASGVYFNGALWVFELKSESSDFVVHSDIYVKQYTNSHWVSAPQCGGSTWATVVPLVISHELWAFCTAGDGTLAYKRFLTISNDWENGDGHWNRIGTLTTDVKHEIAPAYNPIQNRLEVYYHYNNNVYLAVSDDRGLNWSGGRPVAGMTNAVSAPSAVFYPQTETNGVTLVAEGIRDAAGEVCPTIFWVQNGAVVKSRAIATALHGRPFLADLGEDYFALIWTTKDQAIPQMLKVNKHTGEWGSPYRPFDEHTFWPPNLAVSYEQETVTNSALGTLGIRWNANEYLFWGNQTAIAGDEQTETMSYIERLGHWEEEGTPTRKHFGHDVTNCFQFWTVLGVVDAPPFIVNGDREYEDDPPEPLKATRVEFGVEQSQTVESSTSWSVGPFIESGEKSPIKVEASYSYAEEHANGAETKTVFNSTLLRGKKSPVMVYYLTPEVEVHHVRWYNPDPTTNYMYPMLVTTNTIAQCWTFDPTTLPTPEGTIGISAPYFDLAWFPVHKQATDRARLATYATPTNAFWDAYWYDGIINWMDSQEQNIWWVQTTNHTEKTDQTIKYKFGSSVVGLLSMGVEGSWEATTKTITSMTTSAAVHIDNHFPGPITQFSVEGRWLEPDERGHWVPRNRQGMGDKPWFITYEVYGILP